MESSIAAFLSRQPARERLPTYSEAVRAKGRAEHTASGNVMSEATLRLVGPNVACAASMARQRALPRHPCERDSGENSGA